MMEYNNKCDLVLWIFSCVSPALTFKTIAFPPWRVFICLLARSMIISVKYIIPLACVTETQNILCEAGTVFLNIICMNFRLQKVKQAIDIYLR
jgi:hypothetical protein